MIWTTSPLAAAIGVVGLQKIVLVVIIQIKQLFIFPHNEILLLYSGIIVAALNNKY